VGLDHGTRKLLFFNMQFSLLAALIVGLNLCFLEDWRPIIGKLKHLNSVRDFCSKACDGK
jgi:hypothetical protein